MEFIFGTYATDNLKLVHHRARRRGLQHGSIRTPQDPQPDEPVRLQIVVGCDLQVEQVVVYFTMDGSIPQGKLGTASNGQVIDCTFKETVWDSIVWGYVQHWEGILPPQPAHTMVRYTIGAWGAEQPEVFADNPEPTKLAEKAAGTFFENKPWLEVDYHSAITDKATIFGYHVDTYGAPQWLPETVIYHIFVDRFFPGQGQGWLQTDDLNGICGGTLWGILEKLDYIEALGANCIWLSPTWLSPSHHGYDATDYKQTDPRLGGDEALRRLVDAAHERDIRVLLDLACNHISNEHPIFQSALHDSRSPYRDWFTFNDSPLGYHAFFNVATMPELNLANPAARDWMIEIAVYWLEKFGVDGYRLDYANGPAPQFWADFYAACKQANPASLYFGEVIDAPNTLLTYQGVLDGCLDFHLSEAIRRTYGWQTMSQQDLQLFARRNAAYFPSNFTMPVFLDNHDMDRFAFIAGGDISRLKEAVRFQMSLPNTPIVYYGSEVGLSQAESTRGGGGFHVSRTPMLWGADQNTELLEFYRAQIAERAKRVQGARVQP